MGEANEGLRGGFLSGLEGAFVGELVFRRLRTGSSMLQALMNAANYIFRNATTVRIG